MFNGIAYAQQPRDMFIKNLYHFKALYESMFLISTEVSHTIKFITDFHLTY